jgi:hypothetical protein
MKRICDICKSFIKCNYCVKYGRKGMYLYLEQKRYIDKFKKNISYNELYIFSQTKKD